MHIKRLVLSLAAVCALWLLTLYLEPETNTYVLIKQPTNSTTKNTNPPAQLSHQSEPRVKLNTSKPKGQHTLRAGVLVAIKDRQYSDDPYLELISQSSQVSLCREPDKVKRIVSNYQGITDIQLVLVEEINQICAEHKLQYPTLYAFDDTQELAEMFAPTSALGSLYQRHLQTKKTGRDEPQLKQRLLQETIKAEYSNIIIDFNSLYFFDNDLIQTASELIGTKDENYSLEVSKLAVQMLLCEFNHGIDCERTSWLMIFECASNRSACGLDLPTWYQQSTMPGMQKDVKKLMDYYRNFGR